MEDKLPDGVSVQLSRKERAFLQHRGEIISAAEGVFAEKGYVSTTMEEIARRSEFAVGTLYKFFENKANLHTEILHTKLDQLEKEASAVFESTGSPLEKIESYFHLRISFFWKNREYFQLLFQETATTVCDSRAGFSPDILERYETFLNRVENIFAQGIKAGQFRPIGKQILALSLEGLLHLYLIRLGRQDNPRRNRKEEKQLFEVFTQGAVS
jgi:AcrR family transcriptional regulator